MRMLFYSSFNEPVSEPVLYLILTKLIGQNSQKLLDRNLKCIYIFIKQASLYQNIILLLISVEYLLRNLASKLRFAETTVYEF